MVRPSHRLLALLLTLWGQAALADSHFIRARGGAGDSLPASQWKDLVHDKIGKATLLSPTRTLDRQITRMGRLAKRPNARATTGDWMSPHFGNGTGERPGVTYPIGVVGIWDPDSGQFHGLHLTQGHEVVSVSINTKRDSYTIMKDGGPLIGGARHMSPGIPGQSTILRSWGKRGRRSPLPQSIVEKLGVGDPDSLAYEITIPSSGSVSRRIHIIPNEAGGLIDSKLGYDVYFDPHTGALTHIDGAGRETVVDPGKDPWKLTLGTSPAP